MLTTQNLALLFGDLGLNTLLHTRLDALALSCFEWICALPADADRTPSCATGDGQEHGICVAPDGVLPVHARDEPQQRSTIDTIEAHFAAQPEVFRKRFLPAMLGLRLAMAGQRLPQHNTTPDGARVFLGWTTQLHWLLLPASSMSCDQ